MKISAEEIKKIALLSRLEVKDDQIETVGKQLNDILSYMDLLGQVDVTGVKPTAHAVAMSNVMRDDVPSRPSLMKSASKCAGTRRRMLQSSESHSGLIGGRCMFNHSRTA